MSVLPMLTRLTLHVSDLLARSTFADAGWNRARKTFTQRLAAGVALAGDVMVTDVVRALPAGHVDMRHRYKNFDRMLGEVDLVPVAAAQMEAFGHQVDDKGDWVIPIDLSDICKPYAEKMEALCSIHDGSEGKIDAKGYQLVTACAVNLGGAQKRVPLPLKFEAFSSAEEGFKSQPAIWLETISQICDATTGGTIAMDREADSGKILKRVLDRKRHFVVRLKAGYGCRNLVTLGEGTKLVSTLVQTLPRAGWIDVTRLSEAGEGSPYRADVSFAEVRLPGRPERLWMCVYHCEKHAQPMVLLTTRAVQSAADAAATLARYFARWAIEELHRFAKQAFKLENVRTLTLNRTKNLVAATWMVMGALAIEGRLPCAETTLRAMEMASDRVEAALTDGQFWGYALVDGLRVAVRRNPFLLHRVARLWMHPPTRQLALFGRA